MKAGVYGPTAERLALADRVRLLRSEGLTHAAVGRRLGISRTYAETLFSDPDGSRARARKESYAGTCETCGCATTGSYGRAAAPSLCAACSRAKQQGERFWTQASIVQRFQAFYNLTGRVPTTSESNVSHGARALRAAFAPERVAAVDAVPSDLRLPHPSMVSREFGGWREAVIAAGFTPLPVGRPPGARNRPKVTA